MQKLILVYFFTFLILFSLQGAEKALSILAPLDQTIIAAYKERRKAACKPLKVGRPKAIEPIPLERLTNYLALLKEQINNNKTQLEKLNLQKEGLIEKSIMTMLTGVVKEFTVRQLDEKINIIEREIKKINDDNVHLNDSVELVTKEITNHKS
jgi:cell division protein FtsB